jgi:hypothetical protein
MEAPTMHIRRLGGVLVVAGLLLMPAGRADALTAGTGTAMVTVIANPLSPGSSTLTISATFDDNTYDLGVNLGPLGKLSATSVALTNVNLGQGAHFDIPFTDTTPPITTNAFHAVGDIACFAAVPLMLPEAGEGGDQRDPHQGRQVCKTEEEPDLLDVRRCDPEGAPAGDRRDRREQDLTSARRPTRKVVRSGASPSLPAASALPVDGAAV